MSTTFSAIWSRYLLLTFNCEDYPHRPTQILLACFLFTYMLPSEILGRSPNIELLQTKHCIPLEFLSRATETKRKVHLVDIGNHSILIIALIRMWSRFIHVHLIYSGVRVRISLGRYKIKSKRFAYFFSTFCIHM